MTDRLSRGIQSETLQPTFDIIDKTKGTILYNHNQHEVEIEQDGGEKEKAFEYDSLRVDYPVNANTIFETLITELYPKNKERKLINDYNAANAKVEAKEKAQPYLDFLNHRKALRVMIDADCSNNNIALD